MSSNKIKSSSERPSSGRAGNRTTSEELALYKKRNALERRSSNGSLCPTPDGSAHSSREAVDSSNISIGFNGEHPKSAVKGMRGSSLTESRKRIAEAVGRKPSS